MCGSATLAIEVSRTSIKAARATVAAISQGLAFGFHCELLSTSAVIRFFSARIIYLGMTMQIPSQVILVRP
jgi:hypothetical protein